ncbi:hypothetical protein BGZ95_000350 [Linnemannia exigua]|uniref:Major facilitator superfamily (MFS) profile domain-containing protein n=1 Tax=Linnemannia exigua TaxID=604196 RepID=A0AAD4H3I2_9FUNG|nr:hypothetical protein BGZ95_000350 [Linnemannia exigua]
MTAPEEQHQVVYRTYKARYFGLFSIVLLNIATGFVWLSYSSVPDAARIYLNSDDLLVSLTSILYFVAYIIMAPISGWMFEKHGIKKSLIFGASIQIVGAWLRYFAHFIDSTPENNTGRLVLTMVGQVIAAGAQPFFLSLPPKFAAVWFSDQGRTTATMIGSVSNALAAALAQLIIPIVTNNEDPSTMSHTTLFTAILAIVALIPALFVADRPPTPPSPSAAEALQDTAEEPFKISLKKVGTNKQFLLLMIIFGSLVGVFNTVTSLIATFTKPYGYENTQAGYFGAAMVIAGLIGAGISGPVIDKTKQYKSLSKTCIPLATAFLIALIFVVRRDCLAGIMAVMVFIGLCAFAVLPAALELAVEITYPVTPASSASILWAFGQLCAIIMLFVCTALQDDTLSAEKGLNPPLIFLAAWATVFGAIPIMLITSPYKRLEAEAAKRKRDEAGSLTVVGGVTSSSEKQEAVDVKHVV